MEILFINSEKKLHAVVSMIGRKPLSWDGWHCLYISPQNLNEDMVQDYFLCAKSIIQSYLPNADGRVFMNDSDMHIISKNVSLQILQQTAQQIHDLVKGEIGFSCAYEIYNLRSEGHIYAQKILSKLNHIPSALPAYDALKKSAEKDSNSSQDDKPLKVLLVEDDPVTRWIVRNSLKNTCDFASATSVNKAYAMFKSFQPDLVFLDIGLPDGDGRQVLDWIQKQTEDAQIVMLSGNDNMDCISQALAQGAEGFIAKPFLKEHLLHYIEAYNG